MWFSNRDVSDTAVTIFTMTEAMLMKLQVSFKNYLEFADQNNSENGHFLRSERYAKDFKINSFGKQNSYHLIG